MAAFTASLAETLTTTDVVTRDAALRRTASEVAPSGIYGPTYGPLYGTDLAGTSARSARSTADTVTGQDSSAGQRISAGVVSETLSSSDAATRGVVAHQFGLAESVPTTDTASPFRNLAAAPYDVVTTSDAARANHVFTVGLSEVVGPQLGGYSATYTTTYGAQSGATENPYSDVYVDAYGQPSPPQNVLTARANLHGATADTNTTADTAAAVRVSPATAEDDLTTTDFASATVHLVSQQAYGSEVLLGGADSAYGLLTGLTHPRPGSGAHLRLFDMTGQNLLAILPEFISLNVMEELNAPGSLTADFPLTGRNVRTLADVITQQTALLGLWDSGRLAWLGRVDQDSDDPGEDVGADRTLNLTAIGTLDFLAWLRLFPQGGLDSQPIVDFVQLTPGAVFLKMLSDAQARGTLDGVNGPLLTPSFDAIKDSAGNLWPSTVWVRYEAGKTGLEVLNDLVAKGYVDAQMRGLTFDLYATDTYLARDNPDVVFIPAREITSAPRRRARRAMATAVLSTGAANLSLVAEDTTAVNKWGRIEGYVAQGGVSDYETLRAITEATLAENSRPSESYTVEYLRDTSLDQVGGSGQNIAGASPQPWRDYRIGDYVRASFVRSFTTLAENVEAAQQVYEASSSSLAQQQAVLASLQANAVAQAAIDQAAVNAAQAAVNSAPNPDALATAQSKLADAQSQQIADQQSAALAIQAEQDLITRLTRVVGQDQAAYEQALAQQQGAGSGMEPLRVRSIAVTVDKDGQGRVSLELNDLLLEADVRLARQVNALLNGSSSLTSGPTVNIGADTIAPLAPGAVYVHETFVVDPSGQPAVFVQVSWPQVLNNTDGTAYSDTGAYLVDYRVMAPDGTWGAWSGDLSTQSLVMSLRDFQPTQTIQARVAVSDATGNRSPYTLSAIVTLAAKTTGPPQPTAPHVTSLIGGLRISWDGTAFGSTPTAPLPMGADYAYTQVHLSTLDIQGGFTPSAATLYDTLPGPPGSSQTTISGLAYGAGYFVRLVAVDTSGNLSPASPPTGPVQPHTVGGLDLNPTAITDTDHSGLFGAGTGFTVGGSLVVDTAAFEGTARKLLAGQTAAGVGYGGLKPGRYRATWLLRTDPGLTPPGGALATVNITGLTAVVQSDGARTVLISEVGQHYTPITVLFTVAGGTTTALDLPVTALQTLYVSMAYIEPVQAFAIAEIGAAYIGSVYATAIQSGTVGADLIVGNRIRVGGGVDGTQYPRYEMTTAGVDAFNAYGQQVLKFNIADGSLSLSGDIKDGSTFPGQVYTANVVQNPNFEDVDASGFPLSWSDWLDPTTGTLQGSILRNGDFEIPAGQTSGWDGAWQVSAGGAPSGVAIDSSAPLAGTQSLHVTQSTNQQGIGVASTSFNVQPGETLRINALVQQTYANQSQPFYVSIAWGTAPQFHSNATTSSVPASNSVAAAVYRASDGAYIGTKTATIQGRTDLASAVVVQQSGVTVLVQGNVVVPADATVARIVVFAWYDTTRAITGNVETRFDGITVQRGATNVAGALPAAAASDTGNAIGGVRSLTVTQTGANRGLLVASQPFVVTPGEHLNVQAVLRQLQTNGVSTPVYLTVMFGSTQQFTPLNAWTGASPTVTKAQVLNMDGSFVTSPPTSLDSGNHADILCGWGGAASGHPYRASGLVTVPSGASWGRVIVGAWADTGKSTPSTLTTFDNVAVSRAGDGPVMIGATITGPTIETATSGKRIVIASNQDVNSISFYSSSTDLTHSAAIYEFDYTTSFIGTSIGVNAAVALVSAAALDNTQAGWTLQGSSSQWFTAGPTSSGDYTQATMTSIAMGTNNATYNADGTNRVQVPQSGPIYGAGQITLAVYNLAPSGGVYETSLKLEDTLVSVTNDMIVYGGLTVQGSYSTNPNGSTGRYHPGNLSVNGSKNFRIAHPTLDGHDLVHATLEGPENGLYYRGTATLDAKGRAEVVLPDYFTDLHGHTEPDILLTPVVSFDKKGRASAPRSLAASRVRGGRFTIVDLDGAQGEVSWLALGTRGDIEHLKVVVPSNPAVRPERNHGRDMLAPVHPADAPRRALPRATLPG